MKLHKDFWPILLGIAIVTTIWWGLGWMFIAGMAFGWLVRGWAHRIEQRRSIDRSFRIRSNFDHRSN